MTFTRNFYGPSDQCPKCGTSNPKPKYYPENTLRYELELYAYKQQKNWFDRYTYLGYHSVGRLPVEPKREEFVVPDYVVNLCLCGYEWKSIFASQPESLENTSSCAQDAASAMSADTKQSG